MRKGSENISITIATAKYLGVSLGQEEPNPGGRKPGRQRYFTDSSRFRRRILPRI